MVEVADYKGLTPAWCPGCGNFGIVRALNRALVELGLEPHQILLVSGIGQAGKLPHYTRGNVFNSLHGRAVPVAIGAKITNPELKVIVVGGDGDGYGEGGNHFIHAARRNHSLTYLVHDNRVYGLTKGQASPTSEAGFVTKTTPEGAASPVNPMMLALAVGATFIARSYAADTDHLSNVIKQAINHKGFALVDIFQPCVAFNHRNTYEWYSKRLYKLEDEKGYNSEDKDAAIRKSREWGDRIPIGVFYQTTEPSYEDGIPALKNGPLVKQSIEPARAGDLFAEFY